MIKNVLRPLILFLVGFCVYITVEVCFRGYSYPLMGFVAGLVMLYLDGLNDVFFSWDMDILLQGCIGSALITLAEGMIGITRSCLDLAPMWDYSNMPFNCYGVICLPFSLIWIGLSIAAIMVADAINYYVFKILPIPYYRLFGKVIIRYK